MGHSTIQKNYYTYAKILGRDITFARVSRAFIDSGCAYGRA